MAAPRISVLMPVYNTEAYLAQALESIARQTYTDFEFVIVDDGSTDRTVQILDDFAQRDKRVKLLRRPNTGIVGALNDGLALCQGEFIARMDADDIAWPERFARQVAFMDARPGCIASGCAIRWIDPEGDPLLTYKQATTHAEIMAICWNGRGAIPHNTLFARRTALLAAGGYCVEYQWAEDLDLQFRLAEQGELACLDEVLLDYRVHPGSVSRQRLEEQNSAALRAVNAACVRAGKPEKQAIELALPARLNLWQTHQKWASQALLYGNFRTARKHAWRTIRLKPLVWRNWYLAAKVLLRVQRPVKQTLRSLWPFARRTSERPLKLT